jgi:putative PIG3 family NAD(P)H quinone oxidoreductase
MKAILINNDQSLSWTDVPDPICCKDQLIIEVHAAAVNRADIMQRAGDYPPPAGWPEWPGLEVSGIIRELSPEAAAQGSLKTGDKVCALLGGGGYAEYVAVPSGMVMPIPKGLSMIEAAALPEVYATSWLNLFIEGRLEAGQTAFIPAGASGLASAAIPMAKAFGARVITSVLDDELAIAVEYTGADIIINSSKQKATDILKAEMEAGRPVNVAMDCLAGQEMGDSLPYMAHGGYWILLSVLAGKTANISLWPLITGGVHLVGSTLRSRTPEMKARILRDLVRNVWPKIESVVIKPHVYKVFPIQDADAAQAEMDNNRHIGKIVLKVK